MRRSRVAEFPYTPAEDRVVIEILDDPEVSPGGIILAPQARERPVRGTVVALGPPALHESGQRREVGYIVGDEVVFGEWSGSPARVPGWKDGTLRIMRQGEIQLYRRAVPRSNL